MNPIHDEINQAVNAYTAAFNRGDVSALSDACVPNSIVVPQPGKGMAGPERDAANAHLLGMGVPMRAEVRHVYAVEDVALVLVDWSMRGTTEQGHPVDLGGTATDVFRRIGGTWKYVIDNPMGVQ